MRALLYELAYKNLSTHSAVQRLQARIDAVLLPVCTDAEHTHPSCKLCGAADVQLTQSGCTNGHQQAQLHYSWTEKALGCVGGEALPPDETVST
jgi:hypothetical protein